MIESIEHLVHFLKRFHRHWLDDPSLDPAIIPSDLPKGLTTLYREVGKLAEIDHAFGPLHSQDALVPVNGLRRVDNMIEFATENSGNWTARIPIGMTDPPVYSSEADQWSDEKRGYVPICKSLNHFLITLCLREAIFSCNNLIHQRTQKGINGALIGEFQPLWLDGRFIQPDAQHDFYLSMDGNVLVMANLGLWVGSPVWPVNDLIVPGHDFTRINGA